MTEYMLTQEQILQGLMCVWCDNCTDVKECIADKCISTIR